MTTYAEADYQAAIADTAGYDYEAAVARAAQQRAIAMAAAQSLYDMDYLSRRPFPGLTLTDWIEMVADVVASHIAEAQNPRV